MPADTPVPFEFTEPIRTDRLILRLMTTDDVDDISVYQSLEEVCRYLLFEPRSREEVAEKVAKHAQQTTLEKDGDYLQLALELPGSAGARGRVIGDSYFTITSIENSQAEIGWTMHPDFTGRGYATEAASAVLDVAFRQIELHRVHAELDPRNDASIALCIRLGMREEAHFVEDLKFRGGWADTGVYGLLRSEWMSR
jgi:RimJ/RimL family protein N-acetyltransferase